MAWRNQMQKHPPRGRISSILTWRKFPWRFRRRCEQSFLRFPPFRLVPGDRTSYTRIWSMLTFTGKRTFSPFCYFLFLRRTINILIKSIDELNLFWSICCWRIQRKMKYDFALRCSETTNRITCDKYLSRNNDTISCKSNLLRHLKIFNTFWKKIPLFYLNQII